VFYTYYTRTVDKDKYYVVFSIFILFCRGKRWKERVIYDTRVTTLLLYRVYVRVEKRSPCVFNAEKRNANFLIICLTAEPYKLRRTYCNILCIRVHFRRSTCSAVIVSFA